MNSLKTIKSNFSVTESVNRMISQIEEEGWHLFARIDHAKEAQKRDLALRPTELILFGNPSVGTLLMQNQQISAIDLPMKVLAWEDENGEVYVTYNNLTWLKKRHGLTDDNAIDQVAKVVENICRKGTKKTI